MNTIRTAQAKSFREAYKIGADTPCVLSEGEVDLLIVISTEHGGAMLVDKNGGEETTRLRAALPAFLHWHYEQFLLDTRFDRFVLFVRGEKDGLIVGVGKDERYYVLAVWDAEGEDKWTPNPGEQNPLIAPPRTIAR